MSSSRALAIVAVIGVLIFALSFVNGWIVHDLEIRGEGFRHSETILGAWRSVAMPVLSIGALAALATSVAAAARRAEVPIPGWLLPGGAAATLALVASSVVPLGWNGHTTSVDLSPAPLTWVGLALAGVMLAAAAVVAPLGLRGWAILGGAGVVLLLAAVGGRQATLTASGPSNQAWSDGTYLLVTDTGRIDLVIEEGRYRIGDRWTGTWEGTGGWTVALDGDLACPDSRGAYHARSDDSSGGEGTGDVEVDLRFVMIVDTCESGARAELLESGIWERQP